LTGLPVSFFTGIGFTEWKSETGRNTPLAPLPGGKDRLSTRRNKHLRIFFGYQKMLLIAVCFAVEFQVAQDR